MFENHADRRLGCPLICMLKCLQARRWSPNCSCSFGWLKGNRETLCYALWLKVLYTLSEVHLPRSLAPVTQLKTQPFQQYVKVAGLIPSQVWTFTHAEYQELLSISLTVTIKLPFSRGPPSCSAGAVQWQTAEDCNYTYKMRMLLKEYKCLKNIHIRPVHGNSFID